MKQNIPFVSYRLPLETEIVTLVQHHSLPESVTDLNDVADKAGFVMAPFTTQDHQTWFLKPDCVFFNDEIDDIYIEKLANNNRFLDLKKSACQHRTTTSDDYMGNVEKAVTAMKADEFHKVVLSKVRVERLPDDFSTDQFFQKLCAKYPHAMVYLLNLPEVGCWMGATPEPLLVVENERVKTVSLAGTQVSTGAELEEYRWSEKEIEEQGIVTDFVEQTLRNLGVTKYHKQGPENYQAANLIHLKTAFEFSQKELDSQFSDFVNALHPTPSVGGLPKTEAREFILKHENHDRSYYTGFLGPMNINNKTDLFVNLRCLQLFDKQFVLYSGAGITASSDPEKEWVETDNKMLTMMNVMMSPNAN
jgi:isochorismate synthase